MTINNKSSREYDLISCIVYWLDGSLVVWILPSYIYKFFLFSSCWFNCRSWVEKESDPGLAFWLGIVWFLCFFPIIIITATAANVLYLVYTSINTRQRRELLFLASPCLFFRSVVHLSPRFFSHRSVALECTHGTQRSYSLTCKRSTMERPSCRCRSTMSKQQKPHLKMK